MLRRSVLLSGLGLGVAATMARAEAPVLRVAVEGSYPPFNEVGPDGKLKGLDIDIAKALCSQMKVECRFKRYTWDQLQDSFTGKNNLLGTEYDAIISSVSITPSRRQTADFTNKYYHSPARFVRRVGSGIEPTITGLRRKVIGVQGKTTHDNYVTAVYGGVAKVQRYPTLGAAMDALRDEQVDVVMGDTLALVGSEMRGSRGKGVEFVGPSFTDGSYFGYGAGIPVRKGDNALRKRLDQALAAIRADGTHATILSRYFDADLYGE